MESKCKIDIILIQDSNQIIYIKTRLLKMLDQQESKLASAINLIFMIVACFFAYAFWKIRKVRRNKQIIRTLKDNLVEQHKIIIALEIKDFFVKYSRSDKTGYIPLEIQQNQQNLMKSLIQKIFKYGNYYKPMFSIKKIQDFIVALQSVENVQIMIYTCFSRKVTQAILVQLKIDHFFPDDKRRFCRMAGSDFQKHAIMVDQLSQRVIIITPSLIDHMHEDQKYFLVLRPNSTEIDFLNDFFKEFKPFLEANQDTATLHEELSIFKVDLEAHGIQQLP